MHYMYPSEGPGRVKTGQFFVAQVRLVGSAIYGLGRNLKNFP